MSFFIRKINSFSWMPIFKCYFIWLGFTSVIFILTHAFSALTLIQAYRFRFLDMFFTYGFLILLGLLETALFALLLTGLFQIIQKLLHRDPSPVFRLLVLAWFGLSWLNLLLALFNRSLFTQ